MEEICDGELIARFRESGEMRHFDELVRRHIRRVRAMIYPMVLNHADADDLTQETFVRATRHIAGFRQRAKFSTWLYRIAMNTTKTYLARKKREPVDYCAEPPESSALPPAESGSFPSGEDNKDIQQALADLSPSLRSAITLIAIQGMAVREAARIDGCLAATMYWRVYEARRQLKKRLGRCLKS